APASDDPRAPDLPGPGGPGQPCCPARAAFRRSGRVPDSARAHAGARAVPGPGHGVALPGPPPGPGKPQRGRSPGGGGGAVAGVGGDVRPGPESRGKGRGVRSLEDDVRGGKAGHRAWIARAITLVESTRPDHREMAQELLVELTPLTGHARRVGISGVPGVGKSTFVDGLGTMLTGQGHRVAVLAVDPSSTRTGGSILGDKTRMSRLAADPAAFIRPSPTSGTLGGVAKATREAMVVVEAAGYDVVLVETVGVGQSETAVADMVDTFLLLTLARTGDQLQGIKKGVLELADVIAVNKADGEHALAARKAARELAGALRMLRSDTTPPPV